MSITGCPVCNGMTQLSSFCPQCGNLMEDNGRFLDILGPYSPYRPIDDLKKTDGFIDLKTPRCPHRVSCEQCGFFGMRMVNETQL